MLLGPIRDQLFRLFCEWSSLFSFCSERSSFLVCFLFTLLCHPLFSLSFFQWNLFCLLSSPHQSAGPSDFSNSKSGLFLANCWQQYCGYLCSPGCLFITLNNTAPECQLCQAWGEVWDTQVRMVQFSALEELRFQQGRYTNELNVIEQDVQLHATDVCRSSRGI